MAKHIGRDKAQKEAVERFFGGMKVEEATEPLRIFPNEADIIAAKQGSPEECVIAQACHRLFGSSAVLIFKSVAYVDLPDATGIRKVNRFYVPKALSRQIVEYDKTGKFPSNGFTLLPPPESERLDYDRKYQAERAKRIKNGDHKVDPQKSALLKGTVRGVKAAMLTGVRDGSGMVHFVKNAA